MDNNCNTHKQHVNEWQTDVLEAYRVELHADMAHLSQKCDHLESTLKNGTDVFDTAIIETKKSIKNHFENHVSQAMIQIQDTILLDIKKQVTL